MARFLCVSVCCTGQRSCVGPGAGCCKGHCSGCSPPCPLRRPGPLGRGWGLSSAGGGPELGSRQAQAGFCAGASLQRAGGDCGGRPAPAPRSAPHLLLLQLVGHPGSSDWLARSASPAGPASSSLGSSRFSSTAASLCAGAAEPPLGPSPQSRLTTASPASPHWLRAARIFVIGCRPPPVLPRRGGRGRGCQFARKHHNMGRGGRGAKRRALVPLLALGGLPGEVGVFLPASRGKCAWNPEAALVRGEITSAVF